MTTQETINRAVAWAMGIAQDSSHGYDQQKRWGPDYDCSSFVITAWQEAGVPVKTKGASYTGNMYFAFLACGFTDVTNKVNIYTGGGMKKGDVLLNKANHTEMYLGDGKCVKASINEKGTVTGGKPGDQTGNEIYIGRYYNYPWDCVLRYEGGKAEADESEETPAEDWTPPTLAKGSRGIPVLAMQAVLIARGFSCGPDGADGDLGANTEQAVKRFQVYYNLEADGICGNATWKKLLGVST